MLLEQKAEAHKATEHAKREKAYQAKLLDCIIAMMDMVPFNHSLGIENSIKAWPGILSSFEAKDGLFVMQVGREHQFERMAHAIGKP